MLSLIDICRKKTRKRQVKNLTDGQIREMRLRARLGLEYAEYIEYAGYVQERIDLGIMPLGFREWKDSYFDLLERD